ncbi:MAG TPA: ATP-grasp domain-containing protein [Thermoanaerobaculia bacterium]|nr:ATP-grasp domain-containing protein [Thermoanaerobaculia bacterium]
MNITVLTGLESDNPGSYDPVVDQVASALREHGHQVSIFAVYKSVGDLVEGLSSRKPDLVFNLLESFGDDTSADVSVAGLLNLLGLHYTGGGPGELYLRQDKALAKKALAFDGIPYPHFAVFTQDANLETFGQLRMPLFVKPLCADASIGIDGDSLVRDSTALMRRVLDIHEKVKDSALVEEYIEGREFYVGVLGNRETVALPPIEMDFSGLPEGVPRVLGSKAKWSPESVEYKGTKSILADLPDEMRARLQKTALDAARALRVRDYGRVDLRLADTGDIYVIEVNANCYLEKGSEFAVAAAAQGIEFPELIQRIVELAVERYAATGQSAEETPPLTEDKEAPAAVHS